MDIYHGQLVSRISEPSTVCKIGVHQVFSNDPFGGLSDL